MSRIREAPASSGSLVTTRGAGGRPYAGTRSAPRACAARAAAVCIGARSASSVSSCFSACTCSWRTRSRVSPSWRPTVSSDCGSPEGRSDARRSAAPVRAAFRACAAPSAGESAPERLSPLAGRTQRARSGNLAQAESRAEGQQVDPGASRQRARRRMVPGMVRRPVRALGWVSAIVFIVLTVVLWGWAAAVASAAGLHRLQARPGLQERSPSRSSARATALLGRPGQTACNAIGCWP
jgi:hypothetical protein